MNSIVCHFAARLVRALSCMSYVIALSIPHYGYSQASYASQDSNTQYDLVLRGGRVIDPETGLDAVRNIGIRGNRIASITDAHLMGKRIIDLVGLVVSPGFIDLHQHGQDAEDYRLKAFDGVTSALEMEIGRNDVERFLMERESGTLINFGTTANFDAARALAFNIDIGKEIIPMAGPATNDPTTPSQMLIIIARLEHEIQEGALGIGIGLQYVPGASREEILDIFRLAAENHLPVYTHIRSAGHNDPDSSVQAVGEVIADAAITGTSLHIVHINSSCLKDGPVCLAMIAGARGRGLDVTTEAYPYTAGLTDINSALFNTGWQRQLGISYSDLAIPNTGERLTKESFEKLHADPIPHEILLYLNSDATVDKDITNPLVMIASDGEQGHPREAGTYCRILSRYVREQRSLTLIDAIRKMSLMPAQMLEASTAEGFHKGRIQVGADADIVAFDPATVHDASTYSHPSDPSVGMKYVIVQGTPIIVNGELQPNTLPGKAIVRIP